MLRLLLFFVIMLLLLSCTTLQDKELYPKSPGYQFSRQMDDKSLRSSFLEP